MSGPSKPFLADLDTEEALIDIVAMPGESSCLWTHRGNKDTNLTAEQLRALAVICVQAAAVLDPEAGSEGMAALVVEAAAQLQRERDAWAAERAAREASLLDAQREIRTLRRWMS
mgnify:CR=1 FL=1